MSVLRNRSLFAVLVSKEYENFCTYGENIG